MMGLFVLLMKAFVLFFYLKHKYLHVKQNLDLPSASLSRLDPNRRYTVILWPKIRLNSCPIRADRKLVLITHGFLNNGNSSWMSDIKDNYLIEVSHFSKGFCLENRLNIVNSSLWQWSNTYLLILKCSFLSQNLITERSSFYKCDYFFFFKNK